MAAQVQVLLAPDKFKGSLTAAQVAAHLASGLAAAAPWADVIQMPIADGGDGTVDAAVTAGFERVAITASGPTGTTHDTSYARRGDVAVIEMADVCGLLLLDGSVPAPLTASSYGLGEMLLDAISKGARSVVLGIGGSASTDGGAGLLEALGARLLDGNGRPIPRGGGALRAVAALDLGGLDPAFASADIIVASDVDNPLFGPHGAAYVYAPQKGATPEDVVALDEGLRVWAKVAATATGRDLSAQPGAGAAGGVGLAAISVLGARLEPGIEVVLDLLGFADRLEGCTLVVTGEGNLDEQTLAGKAPAGVARAAAAAGITTVAVAGRNELAPLTLQGAGIARVYALADVEPVLDRSLAHAGALLERLAADIARDWLAQPTHFAGNE